MRTERVSLATGTTRSLVLDLIRSYGPVSRVELAQMTGMTATSMTNVVRSLIADDLVIESGRAESTGGKPRILVELNPRARYAVGVQLGFGSLTTLVADSLGSIVARVKVPAAGDTHPLTVVEQIAEAYRTLIDAIGLDAARIAGMGVVAAGPLDLQNGALLLDRPEWGEPRFPLAATIQQATGLPVVLDNDATAAAIGHFWTGGVQDTTVHCTVFVGDGMGAGIVLNGAVFRGASSNTGEIGKTTVSSFDGSVGPVEDIAGPRGVLRRARAVGLGDVLGADDDYANFAALASAAISGNPAAIEILESSADLIAEQVVRLVDVLDASSVVLAGPALTIAGSIYLTRIRTHLADRAYARSIHPINVTLSPHPADAAAIGAAALVLQADLAPRSLNGDSRALYRAG